MRSSLTPLGPPVSRDRIITSFPKWYTPDACLQLKEHFHGQVSSTCQSRNTGTVGLRLSKVVVVGDLYVGKTSLIHRFCKNVFDRDYKATIGVDFEIERFEIAGIPFSLQMQWLEDALRENEPGSCFVFLVGTKKDLLSGAACEQAEMEAVRLASEMRAEYWSVSAKTGENVKAFFSRVAALAFEQSVLQDLERRSSAQLQVGDGDLIRAYRQQGGDWGAGLQPKIYVHHPPVPRAHSLNSSPCAVLSGLSFLPLLGPQAHSLPDPACQLRLPPWLSLPFQQLPHEPGWASLAAWMCPGFGSSSLCLCPCCSAT
ncbi:ras-related protein Rab-36 isoform X1 [Panthera pardus]|uniref:Ras-related protein Rab-36 isoform X1 n=1 Tax=Panthera pardus TaxID=9691 RepID=A0A9W2VIF4_PANPR|nr:ras-related protein Rab-36 isoform X1 [Panthera pardus]